MSTELKATWRVNPRMVNGEYRVIETESGMHLTDYVKLDVAEHIVALHNASLAALASRPTPTGAEASEEK